MQMARRSLVESRMMRSGTRKVACIRSNRRVGSTPYTMKKGECPVDLQMVAWSAQKAKGATSGQWDLSLSHALTINLQIVQCCHLMMLFACELYGDMQMCYMPYLSASQSRAVT